MENFIENFEEIKLALEVIKYGFQIYNWCNHKTNKTYNKMKWKIDQHKRGNGTQEIKVSILVKDMANTYAFNSESWIEQFKDRLKEIPRTNSFSADFGYKATQRNQKSLEVWKMKVNGDFNYKMFTVTLIEDDNNN